METIESESNSDISKCGQCPLWKNLVKIFANSYFSDFEPLFRLFGGVCVSQDWFEKNPLAKKNLFYKRDIILKDPRIA